MQRRTGHKGAHERALLTARAKIGALIDSGQVVDSAREELEEISALIRSVELSVGQKRLGETRLKNPSLEFIDPVMDGEKGGVAQSRHKLLQVYTDCDLAAAEGNQAISPRRTASHGGAASTSPKGRQKDTKRMSTLELDARVAAVLTVDSVLGILKDVGCFSFDAAAFSAMPEVQSQPVFILFTYMEDSLRLSKQLRDLCQVSSAASFHSKIMHFMEKIERSYKENPYHNNAHAADVIMTLEWFFRSQYLQARMSPLDHLMSLIAGAIHDVGHPGTNNLFQAKTMSPLAIRYNDKSILENMHVSLSFEIMRNDPSCDWFEMFPQDFRPQGAAQEAAVNLHQYVRKGLVHMVLATDMAKHAKSMQDLKIFVEEQGEAEVLEDGHERKQEALAQKLFLMETVVHAADISNPTKPRPMMLQWTQRILQEFWNQGDEERRLELPISPLCDRAAEQAVVPKGQLGFINFVIQPLFGNLAKLIPEVQEATDQLEQNRAFWEEKDREQATYEQIFGVKPA